MNVMLLAALPINVSVCRYAVASMPDGALPIIAGVR